MRSVHQPQHFGARAARHGRPAPPTPIEQTFPIGHALHQEQSDLAQGRCLGASQCQITCSFIIQNLPLTFFDGLLEQFFGRLGGSTIQCVTLAGLTPSHAKPKSSQWRTLRHSLDSISWRQAWFG
ncbi:MAG: hypothetical protein AAF702_45765 [Chloroflexota bacterium]